MPLFLKLWINWILWKHRSSSALIQRVLYFCRRDIDAQLEDLDAFLVVKLGVKVLPCVLCFIDGIVIDRVVGFDDLGNQDTFQTEVLERRLLKAGVIQNNLRQDEEHSGRKIRQGGIFGEWASPDDSD